MSVRIRFLFYYEYELQLNYNTISKFKTIFEKKLFTLKNKSNKLHLNKITSIR